MPAALGRHPKSSAALQREITVYRTESFCFLLHRLTRHVDVIELADSTLSKSLW